MIDIRPKLSICSQIRVKLIFLSTCITCTLALIGNKFHEMDYKFGHGIALFMTTAATLSCVTKCSHIHERHSFRFFSAKFGVGLGKVFS